MALETYPGSRTFIILPVTPVEESLSQQEMGEARDDPARGKLESSGRSLSQAPPSAAPCVDSALRTRRSERILWVLTGRMSAGGIGARGVCR